jgi:ribose transport system permease protein
VVGGVSLRGGEGQILGVIIGAAIIRVLYNAINVAGVSTQLEQVVLGLVILIGVAADEVVRMISARRKVRESMALAQKALEESRAAAANR